jgi:ribosomal protein S18 acetylase RimI-like enzyme
VKRVTQTAADHRIVPAGPADAGALARVHVQSWRETYGGVLPAAYLDGLSVATQARRFQRRLLIESEFTLAAEAPDGMSGYCSGDWTRAPGARQGGPDGEGEIHTLYVLRKAQGRGLGRALLTAGARVLAARGARSMIIWVLRENAPARGFYERLGGREAAAGGECGSAAAWWRRWATGGLICQSG